MGVSEKEPVLLAIWNGDLRHGFDRSQMMMRPNFSRQTIRAARFSVAACALALASCTNVTRIPYTQQEQAAAVIPGIPDARIWADDPAIATVRASVVSRVPPKQPVVLALFGGGADGAFGAALLAGWSARGTRPQFTLVTGASAGALIAPFAFLGPAYTRRSGVCLPPVKWRTCCSRRDWRDCLARVFSRRNPCET